MIPANLAELAIQRALDSEGRIDLWELHRNEYQHHFDRLLAFGFPELAGRRAPMISELEFSLADTPLVAGPRNLRGREASLAFTSYFEEVPEGRPSAGIKDMIHVAGHSNTCATQAFEATRAENDAPIVSDLRAAGVGIAGMLNQHALAYGATGLSSEMGHAVNALDPEVIPGGSSSGSAVAVAAGLVDFAIGTDTGGSVRIPASLNGVVGFKPTYGRVPVDGIVPLAPSLDHVGLLARTVRDAAAVFSIIDPESSVGRGRQLSDEREIVIGLPRSYFLEELDDSTRESFNRLIQLLESVPQVRLVDIRLQGADLVAAGQLAVLAAQAMNVHLDLLRGRAELLPDDVRLRLELGMLVPSEAYEQALRFQKYWRRSVEVAFSSCHLLLTPTVPVNAPRVDSRTVRLSTVDVPMQAAVTRLTSPFNLSGHPAITLPFPETDRRIPMGVQMVAPWGADTKFLAVARVVESMLTG